MGGAPGAARRHAMALATPSPDVDDASRRPGAEPPTITTPLQEWRALAKRTFITVAAFSVFVNVLMLTVPIYLFQISDRVLTSRSIDTLLMLSMLAIVFLAVLSLLDICRRQVLGALANRLETMLGRAPSRQRHLNAARASPAARRRRCAACTTCATSSPARSCCCCSTRRWRRSISPPCFSSARSSASSRWSPAACSASSPCSTSGRRRRRSGRPACTPRAPTSAPNRWRAIRR